MIRSEKLGDWVELFLDQELSDAEAKELLDSFVEKPALKERFVEEVVMCGLSHGLSSNSEKEVAEVMETIRLGTVAPDVTDLVMNDLRGQRDKTMALTVASDRIQIPRRRRGQWSIGFGIAACLAVLIFTIFSNVDSGEYATFSRVEGTKWRGQDEPFEVGGTIGGERLDLLSGIAVLKFGDGVRVSIEGPASFHAKSTSQLRLIQGVVSGYVAPSGIGFRVITEHGTITDLGTMFEVSVEKGKTTDVAVLEGVVSFESSRVVGEERIIEGQGVQASDKGIKKTLSKFGEEKQKNHRLEILMGVQGKGGEIRIVSVRNIKHPNKMKSAQSLAVLPERKQVVTEGAVSVNVLKPGTYRAVDLERVVEHLESGDSLMDSFLIQFNPPTAEKGEDEVPFRFRGGIEFDQAIQGIFTNRAEILKSNQRYGKPEINYKDLVKGELEFNDKISLSEDRRTLWVDWIVTPLFDRSRDQIRVLVQSQE